MDIGVKNENGKATISLSGWLDTETAPQLAETLSGLDQNTKELVMDLSELEYISSAGIRQLVAAHKQIGGNLRLCNVSAEVLEVLRMTGVTKRVKIA